MDKKPVIAILLIAVIGVSAVGLYVVFQPVDNPYEVAIVFATGGLGDKSFNDGAYEGALAAQEDYNVNFTYAEPDEISQYETFLRQYASHAGYIQPFDLIISIGFDQADAVMAVAEDYPDQNFVIVDMYIDPAAYPNVASILFNAAQGSALVGAIAGMMTMTGNLGFVGGLDIDLINEFAAGYFWGAHMVNDSISNTNHTAYVGDWADIPGGKTQATGLYTTNDVDVIFAAAGRSGLGVFESAKENNDTSDHPLWVIGVDSPQMYLGCEDPDNPEPPTVGLTSMLKHVNNSVYEMIKDAVIDDDFTGGLKFYNLANDGVGFEINEDLLTLPQYVLDEVYELEQAIINGTYTVPTTLDEFYYY